MNRTTHVDPVRMLRPCRRVEGFSAILLPFRANRDIDWAGFTAHTRRTVEAGLGPAVNMDTGYCNLIDNAIRLRALEITQAECAGRSYVAGAFVDDQPGATFDFDSYARQIEMIQRHGGTPVIFQSYGLTQQSDDAVIAAYTKFGTLSDRYIGFELGPMFAPFGRIYSLDVYRGLMGVRQCIGAKHSSLSRELEWQRILLRDATRPDFRVYTGNDLAIDMIMYGSDYLLGLSTFAPDLFARRDALWASGDPAFYELNDWLQYLGFLAFRPPVPAYKHSAAMFLKIRGWLECDDTHPHSPTRPSSDREILRELARNLNKLLEDFRS